MEANHRPFYSNIEEESDTDKKKTAQNKQRLSAQRSEVQRFCTGIKDSGKYLEKIAKKSHDLNGKIGITFDREGKPIVFRRPVLYEKPLPRTDFQFCKALNSMRRSKQPIKISDFDENSQRNSSVDEEEKINLKLNAKNPLLKKHI